MDHIANPFTFQQGNSPLLVSMPHSGLNLTPQVAQGLSVKAKSLPDTDWFIPQLYSFLYGTQASFIQANYSRYVIDLNRPLNDQPLYATPTTGLFPQVLFDSSPVFTTGGEPDVHHKDSCKQQIWLAYHQQIQQELARLKAKFGFAILFDAHSIAAEVPMLFEGRLPDFNFGNNAGLASDDKILNALAQIAHNSEFSHVCNGRFKGGYITRHFGEPKNGIHAIQLELSQGTYLQDNNAGYVLAPAKQVAVVRVLEQLIDNLLSLTLAH